MTPRPHPRLRSSRRGFTLVELIVALTAGLLVSAAAYLLARNSMKSFQDESRIATGQLAVSVGMGRLQADLARAAYMASPNVQSDPKLCRGDVSLADIPVSAVEIREGTAALTGLGADFGYGAGVNGPLATPDVVVVAGNMTSTEQFEFRGSDGDNIYLAMNRGPMVRLLQDTGGDRTTIRSVFVPLNAGGGTVAPRLARVVDQAGKESYVEVTGVVFDPPVAGVPTAVTLTIRKPVVGGSVTNSGTECGFVNRGTGLVNPVSFVRYRIGQLCIPTTPGSCTGNPYERALVATGPDAVTGESVRADLIREELSPSAAASDKFAAYPIGATGVASREIVAEFAVQLDFEAVIDASAAGSPGTATDVIPYNDGAIDAFTDMTAAPGTPQDVRALRVRLSTRSRVPDRDAAGPRAVTPSLVTRFELTPIPGRNRFARMRTLETEIQLANLQRVTW